MQVHRYASGATGERDATGTRGTRGASHLVKLSLLDFSVCIALFILMIYSKLTALQGTLASLHLLHPCTFIPLTSFHPCILFLCLHPLHPWAWHHCTPYSLVLSYPSYPCDLAPNEPLHPCTTHTLVPLHPSNPCTPCALVSCYPLCQCFLPIPCALVLSCKVCERSKRCKGCEECKGVWGCKSSLN